MKHYIQKKILSLASLLPLLVAGGWLLASCSEEETEATEFDNWQARNEAYFASLADSLSRDAAHWQRIKHYALNPDIEGQPTDYIYVKRLADGTGSESPAFTDSVRVVYQGRLIPSATYPEGYVFDGTVYGQFSLSTSATSRQLISKTVQGYSTALQHMHRGDYWRVYIPSELGYGEDGSGNTIPGYSVLIFDLQLVDFSHPGDPMPGWKSRQRQ